MGKEGLGNFASGFLQGFAGEFKAHRKRQYEQEERELDQKWQMVNQIAKDPTTTPDMLNIIARDLFGKSLKGKEEKEALNTVLGLYGQHIIPSQQAQSSEAQIDKAQSQGAGQEELAQMTRPRMSMTATPRYSPEQMTQMEAQRQGAIAKSRAEAEYPTQRLLMGQQQRFQAEQKLLDRESRLEQKRIEIEGRMRQAGLMIEGGYKKKLNEMMFQVAAEKGRDYINAEEDQEEAAARLNQKWEADIAVKNSQIERTNQWIKQSQAMIKVAQDRLELYGDAISLAFARENRMSQQDAKDYLRSQLTSLTSQLNEMERIIAMPPIGTEAIKNREEAIRKAGELDGKIKYVMNEMNKGQGQPMTSPAPSTPSMTPRSKTLNQRDSKSDPLGIR